MEKFIVASTSRKVEIIDVHEGIAMIKAQELADEWGQMVSLSKIRGNRSKVIQNFRPENSRPK